MYLFLSKEYVSPVLKLSTAASQLENENLEIVTDKSDELGNLGQIFKDMRKDWNDKEGEPTKGSIGEIRKELKDILSRHVFIKK